ncbi:MAG: NPCBM/NEW2 domain-containing protein [Gimesia sp.]|nr:NPCBM/NEW2 domain-containing protein [Gimesia sp.]
MLHFLFPAIICGLSLSFSSAILADEVVLYDGKKVIGQISTIDSKMMMIKVADTTKKINLFDITSYKFIQPDKPQDVCQLLIDGEKPSYATGPRKGKVKLRKGYHRFVLPYFHTVGIANLKIMMSGPNMKSAEIPNNLLYNNSVEVRKVATKDYKVDKEGYRLPVNLKDAKRNVGYRLMEWKPPEEVKSSHDLKYIPVKKRGTTPRLALLSKRSAINFGIVYDTLIKIPKDGEYTFSIETDKNSKAKLYVGSYPNELFKQAVEKSKSGWHVSFAQKGKLTGKLKGFAKGGFLFEVQVSYKELDVPLKKEAIHEMWKVQSDPKKTWRADRKEESDTEDSAYVLTKEGNVHRVTGEVVGMNDKSLLFQYEGQEREINLDRVVGLVLQKKRLKEKSNLALQSQVKLIGNSQFTGEVTVDDNSIASIKMPWGDQISIHKIEMASIRTVNARSVPLTGIVPDSVTQVPFFNQVYPYQVDKSFSGLPLKVGNKIFRRGLCVHSKTVLVYSLGKNFERFQASLGLQEGSGHLGNVDVKIVADGKTIYEKLGFTIGFKQEPLSLDVTNCQTLTLIVDFGKGQDVGDRFVWGDPKLIRTIPKELAASKN